MSFRATSHLDRGSVCEFRKVHVRKSAPAVLAGGALFAAGGVGSAVAGNLIIGDQIAKNTITAANLARNSGGKSEL